MPFGLDPSLLATFYAGRPLNLSDPFIRNAVISLLSHWPEESPQSAPTAPQTQEKPHSQEGIDLALFVLARHTTPLLPAQIAREMLPLGWKTASANTGNQASTVRNLLVRQMGKTPDWINRTPQGFTLTPAGRAALKARQKPAP